MPEVNTKYIPPFKDWTVEQFQDVREKYNKRLNELISDFEKESGADIDDIDVPSGATRWEINVHKYI